MLKMLQDITETDVYSVKLVSKEELIGRIVEITEHEIRMRKPMCLVNSGSGIGMIPWVITGSGLEIYLQIKHLLTVDKASKDIASSYIQSTTGLTL